jgi:hypothetical protein
MFRLPDRLSLFRPVAGLSLLLTACSSELTAPVSRDLGTPARSITTTSTLLIDTGPGGTAVGPVITGGETGAPTFQYLAGQITLATDTQIESVAGWMRVFAAGTMSVHIRSDNGGLPGTDLHSQNYTRATTATFGWEVFPNFNVQLTAGTYWVTFEAAFNSGFVASMANGAANPLASYAFKGDAFPNWSHSFGSTPTLGFQVTGHEVTPESLIGDLQTFLSTTTIPSGNAQSIYSKLQTALNALAANQISTACGSLQAVINYTNAQSGKKIPTADANAIISQVTAIRTKTGC